MTFSGAHAARTAPLTGAIEGVAEDTQGPVAAVPPPATVLLAPSPAAPSEPVELEEVNVVAKRLEAARAAIEPQIGASTYTVNNQAIEAQPAGENNTLNQVLLQAPGVSQDGPSQPAAFTSATRCSRRSSASMGSLYPRG